MSHLWASFINSRNQAKYWYDFLPPVAKDADRKGLLEWSAKCLAKPITNLPKDEAKVAIKLNQKLYSLVGQRASKRSDDANLNVITELVRVAPATLVDEFWCQLIRHYTSNPVEASRIITLRLMALLARISPPSDALMPFVLKWIQASLLAGADSDLISYIEASLRVRCYCLRLSSDEDAFHVTAHLFSLTPDERDLYFTAPLVMGRVLSPAGSPLIPQFPIFPACTVEQAVQVCITLLHDSPLCRSIAPSAPSSPGAVPRSPSARSIPGSPRAPASPASPGSPSSGSMPALATAAALLRSEVWGFDISLPGRSVISQSMHMRRTAPLAPSHDLLVGLDIEWDKEAPSATLPDTYQLLLVSRGRMGGSTMCTGRLTWQDASLAFRQALVVGWDSAELPEYVATAAPVSAANKLAYRTARALFGVDGPLAPLLAGATTGTLEVSPSARRELEQQLLRLHPLVRAVDNGRSMKSVMSSCVSPSDSTPLGQSAAPGHASPRAGGADHEPSLLHGPILEPVNFATARGAMQLLVCVLIQTLRGDALQLQRLRNMEEMTCLLLCNGLSQWGDVTALVARLLDVTQPFEADLVALSKQDAVVQACELFVAEALADHPGLASSMVPVTLPIDALAGIERGVGVNKDYKRAAGVLCMHLNGVVLAELGALPNPLAGADPADGDAPRDVVHVLHRFEYPTAVMEAVDNASVILSDSRVSVKINMTRPSLNEPVMVPQDIVRLYLTWMQISSKHSGRRGHYKMEQLLSATTTPVGSPGLNASALSDSNRLPPPMSLAGRSLSASRLSRSPSGRSLGLALASDEPDDASVLSHGSHKPSPLSRSASSPRTRANGSPAARESRSTRRLVQRLNSSPTIAPASPRMSGTIGFRPAVTGDMYEGSTRGSTVGGSTVGGMSSPTSTGSRSTSASRRGLFGSTKYDTATVIDRGLAVVTDGLWETVLGHTTPITDGLLRWTVRLSELKAPAGFGVGLVDADLFQVGVHNLGQGETSWCYSKTGQVAGGGQSFADYGVSFSSGDEITVEYDGDMGVLRFFVNGEDQGVVTAEGMRYCSQGRQRRWVPAVTLGSTDGGNRVKAVVLDSAIFRPSPYIGQALVCGMSPTLSQESFEITNWQKRVSLTSHWATAIASHEPVESGFLHMQIQIDSAEKGCGLAIGIVDADAFDGAADILGVLENSWCYSKTGAKGTGGHYINYGQKFTTGDTVGLLLNIDKDELTFFHNGVSQGVAYTGCFGGRRLLAALSAGSQQGTRTTTITLLTKYSDIPGVASTTDA